MQFGKAGTRMARTPMALRQVRWLLALVIAGTAGVGTALAVGEDQGIDFTATHGVRYHGPVATIRTAGAVGSSTIIWGDGATTPGTPTATGPNPDQDLLIGDHVYSAAGRYTVTS